MSAAKTQIESWLAERGMSEYAALFAMHKIDISVLPRLTEPHLCEMGVALGDRMKILGWVAELRDGVASLAAKPVDDGKALAAERRQVTVLFSDLVDSTGLSRQLDPEDMREVIRAYQETVTKAIKHYDGFVAGFRGDGVLAYFGYPTAHEDDVERAVRAALELVPAVGAIKSAEPLKSRAGIATGLVVVGDLIGSGDTSERNMVGDAPNLAARLLSMAAPNSVVLSDEAREMLGDLFDFEDLGLRHAKGIEQPVRSWTVMNPRAVESRFEAMHGAALTEFSGRDDELQLLLKRWQKAKSDEGQVVLISGEPGIGKSRLTAALMEALSDKPHTRLRYFCSPQHTDSAFYPVIGHLERAAGFTHGDDAETKLDKLEKVLTTNAVNPEGKSLIAALLSLPTDRYPALDYDAAQRRAKTMEALHGQVVMLCRRGPVLMILEDAHWIDPTSHEAFGRTVEKLKALPVLLVITYRPEFVAPWIGESHVTTINLNRLGNREASQIVASLAGNKPISADVIADIVDRSDGIPLFLEEMTKAVLEAESERAARKTLAAVPSQAHAVPASLHASLMARLDRLGAAKGIAQVGAVIGRSFSHQLLASIARESEAEPARLLDRLVASGLLFRQGQPPDATYLFKHALIRDAAYSMLLREPRRALHARILEALETNFPNIAENQPEILAHHATEAAQIEKAARLWGKAGFNSFARIALVEAQAHLGRALDLIASLPGTPELRATQIEFLAARADVFMAFKGYSAPETCAAFEEARSLIDDAARLGDPPADKMLPILVLRGLSVIRMCAYDRDKLLELSAECLAIAIEQEVPLGRLSGHFLMGSSSFWAGDFLEARAHMTRARELYDPAAQRELVGRSAHNNGNDALLYLSWTLWFLGYPDAAISHAELGLVEARESGNAHVLLHALHYVDVAHRICGNYDCCSAFINELASIAAEKNAEFWMAMVPLDRGAVLERMGRHSEAVDLLVPGLEAWRQTGTTLARPYFLSFLATAHAGLGQTDDARGAIDEAIALLEQLREEWAASDIYCNAGIVAMALPRRDVVAAESYFRRAIEVARAQSAKSVELQAALSLARLWRDQGKAREAYDLVAPIYNWFTEGFGTLLLKESKALLDDLKCELK